MIINNEHKLCRAFDRLLKTRNTLKLCTLYTAIVTMLAYNMCPGGVSNPGPTGPEASTLPLSHEPPWNDNDIHVHELFPVHGYNQW